jgi:hypothetical protein
MKSRIVAGLLVPVLAIFAAGCSDGTAPAPYKNQPPTVWIEAGPPEGGVSSYRIEIRWGGWDPDGSINHYEYCITNNNGSFDPADTTGADRWTRTGKTSDVFVFSADVMVDSIADEVVEEFRRSHTFFIRSVDNHGLTSPRPAYRSFTATTLSPVVDIVVPKRVGLNPANVPPVTTFRWTATDYIDDLLSSHEPDSVSWLLEPLNNHNNDWWETIGWIRNLPVDSPEWYQWMWYGAEDGGKSWTTLPLDFGNYMFAIRAKDEAGAITPVFDESRNMRRILVSQRTMGPFLSLRNRYLGCVGTAVCNTPLTIVDLPAGLPIDFSWEASAADYGGILAGYRYGWDVADLDDPDQWAVDWTPFVSVGPDGRATAQLPEPRVYYFGTHVFTLEVVDNSGFCSRIEIKINIVQYPMGRNLFLVDDFFEGDQAGWESSWGLGILPNDDEHDLYWLNVLENVSGFNARTDVLEVYTGEVIPLTRLADYKSLIWNVHGHVDQIRAYPVLYDLISFRPQEGCSGGGGKVKTNIISLFMAAGGHLLLSGQHPVSMSINDTYAPGVRFPIMFKYDLDLRYGGQDRPDIENSAGAESFPYLDLCLETMDFAYTDEIRRRDLPVCGVNRIRTSDLRNQTLRYTIPLDGNFPALELRPETAAEGQWHEPGNRGLDCEIYNPDYFFDSCVYVPGSRDCFEPIYGLGCLDPTAVVYNQPVAFWTEVYTDVVPDVPNGVPARSAVFGFPPVLFDPVAGKAAIEHILFDEWRLPYE